MHQVHIQDSGPVTRSATEYVKARKTRIETEFGSGSRSESKVKAEFRSQVKNQGKWSSQEPARVRAGSRQRQGIRAWSRPEPELDQGQDSGSRLGASLGQGKDQE
jgi:hypothetical protein